MKIGAEELTVQPETKRALDIELLLRNILVFAVILAYAYDTISWPVFLALFYLAYARFFICSHDRFHTDLSKRLPLWAEWIVDRVALCVTPWVEPYDSIRRKHMTHHRTHRPGKTPVLDTRNDPHSAFEMGGLVRAFLSCLFYEEVQLFFDLRDGKVAKSRWLNVIIYLPLQVWFVISFGWSKYLIVFAAARIAGGVFWFVFSYVIHRLPVYQFGFKSQVPRLFQLLFGLSNGKRTMDGLLRHASHHAWPSVPSSKLDDFDSAVLRNPGSAPEMIPSG